MDEKDELHDALVIGSGPTGLACARELAALGMLPTVVEEGPRPGAAWTARYDAMRFNTGRRTSALTDVPFPPEFEEFPTRDQYVGYLQNYAERFGIRVRTGIRVTRIEPADRGWAVRHGAGALGARQVVVATGKEGRPMVPAWPNRDDFRGELLHSADYRNPEPYVGRDVLVVGAGCSGMEIAHDLVSGGAGRVRIAVRTPPNIMPREIAGRPSDRAGPLLVRLPAPWADRLARVVRRVTIGDLSEFGLPIPTEGPFAHLLRTGKGLTAVDAPVIDAIRAGRICIVPGVESLFASGAVLADGSAAAADAIIAATGYGTGLRPVAGHLGVLDEHDMPLQRDGSEAAPGLRFMGYQLRPGLPGWIGLEARRVAREMAA
ncbi:MAG: flavin-containing monooxygenase [Nocardioides sp.]